MKKYGHHEVSMHTFFSITYNLFVGIVSLIGALYFQIVQNRLSSWLRVDIYKTNHRKCILLYGNVLERLVTVYSGPTVNINLSYKFRRSELGRAFNKDRIFLTRITETNVGFSKQYTMTTPRLYCKKRSHVTSFGIPKPSSSTTFNPVCVCGKLLLPLTVIILSMELSFRV